MDLGNRPSNLDGCWGQWTEKAFDPLIRSNMGSGEPKVRRRFTETLRAARVQVNLTKAQYYDFVIWFDNCLQGVLPTMMTEPTGVESIWRFSQVPQYDWIDPNAVQISVNIEQLPAWR